MAPSVTPEVAAEFGPTVRDGFVPGETVPVRPWCDPGPPPGPDPPGFAGPVALCNGWSSPPAVSDAGLANMACAPTYTATEATAVSITPPTAVTAVWPPRNDLVADQAAPRLAPAPAAPPEDRYAAPAPPSRSGARIAASPELTSVSSR